MSLTRTIICDGLQFDAHANISVGELLSTLRRQMLVVGGNLYHNKIVVSDNLQTILAELESPLVFKDFRAMNRSEGTVNKLCEYFCKPVFYVLCCLHFLE